MPRRRKYVGPVDEKAIGQRLQELRRRRGETQVELAARVGLSQGLLSAYERGELRLHAGLLAALAKALRSSPDQILGFEKMKENGLVKDRRFLRRLPKIDKLSRREKDALLKSLDLFLKGAGVQ